MKDFTVLLAIQGLSYNIAAVNQESTFGIPHPLVLSGGGSKVQLHFVVNNDNHLAGLQVGHDKTRVMCLLLCSQNMGTVLQMYLDNLLQPVIILLLFSSQSWLFSLRDRSLFRAGEGLDDFKEGLKFLRESRRRGYEMYEHEKGWVLRKEIRSLWICNNF